MQAQKILPVAFLFLGAISLVDRFFADETHRLSGIRNQFIQSLSDGRHNLTSLSWAIAQDPLIKQNFLAGNINTVTQSLESYMRPGELSQVDLVDSECNLIVRVPQAARPITDLCQLVKKNKPQLAWQRNTANNESSLVFLAQPDWENRPVFVVTQLVFDQNWVSLHPFLSGLIKNRDVELNALSRSSILWRDGLIDPEHKSYAMVLSIKGIMYQFLPDLSWLALVPPTDSFWVLYGGLGVLIGLMLAQLSWARRRDLLNHMAVSAQIKDESDIQHATKIRLVSDRLEDTTVRLRERERTCALLEDRVSALKNLASLQDQMSQSTKKFLQQMQDMRDECETLHDIAASGLTAQAKALAQFTERWKVGITAGRDRAMSARKFFRQLVETPGQRPGWSKFDDDMRELEVLSSNTLDQALNISMLAQRVSADAEAASKLAEVWHDMAQRDQSLLFNRDSLGEFGDGPLER